MIRGIQRVERILVDDIMFNTNQGFDIFRYYLGASIRRLMSCPWRKDMHPSWAVANNGVFWFYKDFATEETGNAIQFVEKFFSLTFQEAIEKIAYDFGMSKIRPNSRPVVVVWDKPEEQDFTDINIFDRPFTEKHHSFWNEAEISEEHCRKMNCFAVKDLSINRKKVYIGKEEIVFAFYSPEERGFKIYFPERKKTERFRNNVSFHHLWNYDNLSDCKHLIVQKSVKDMIVTTMIDECCIATQAEAVKIFDVETVEKINNISKSPWIWYGSDWDGVKKCKEITDTNKWKYINTESKYLPEVNDTYSFVKMHNLKSPGSGLKELEKFMKEKGISR